MWRLFLGLQQPRVVQLLGFELLHVCSPADSPAGGKSLRDPLCSEQPGDNRPLQGHRPGGLCSALCCDPAWLCGLEGIKWLLVASPALPLAQPGVSWAPGVQLGWVVGAGRGFMVLSWGAQVQECVLGPPWRCPVWALLLLGAICWAEGKGPGGGWFSVGSCGCSGSLAVPGPSHTRAPHRSCGYRPGSVTASPA